jgi:hypothetical protein
VSKFCLCSANPVYDLLLSYRVASQAVLSKIKTKIEGGDGGDDGDGEV